MNKFSSFTTGITIFVAISDKDLVDDALLVRFMLTKGNNHICYLDVIDPSLKVQHVNLAIFLLMF